MNFVDEKNQARLDAYVYRKPTGRPTEYRVEYNDRALNYALLGLKDYEIAHNFNIDISNLHEWMEKYPSFRDAIEKGRVDADGDIAHSLYHRGKGYCHDAVKIFLPPGSRDAVIVPYVEHYPPDTAAAIIWLKNRQPKLWRDKVDVSINVEHNVSPNVLALMDTIAALSIDAQQQQTIEAQTIDVVPTQSTDVDSDQQ